MHKWTFAGVTSLDGTLVGVATAMTDPQDIELLKEAASGHLESPSDFLEWMNSFSPKYTDFLASLNSFFAWLDKRESIGVTPKSDPNSIWIYNSIPRIRQELVVIGIRYVTIAGMYERWYWRYHVGGRCLECRGSFRPFTKEARGRKLTEELFQEERSIVSNRRPVNWSKLNNPKVATETTKKLVEGGISIQPDIFSEEPGKQIFPAIRHEIDEMNKKKDKD